MIIELTYEELQLLRTAMLSAATVAVHLDASLKNYQTINKISAKLAIALAQPEPERPPDLIKQMFDEVTPGHNIVFEDQTDAIKAALQKIEDGARPKKGRFRNPDPPCSKGVNDGSSRRRTTHT